MTDHDVIDDIDPKRALKKKLRRQFNAKSLRGVAFFSFGILSAYKFVSRLDSNNPNWWKVLMFVISIAMINIALSSLEKASDAKEELKKISREEEATIGL